MESLPNGELLAFKTGSREDPGVLWGREFKSPMYVFYKYSPLQCQINLLHSVAIFDVLQSPAQDTFFDLLQPRPQLYTILRNLVCATPMDRLRHLDSVYVRLVEATGSLFAMSPDRFPLVAFSGAGRGRVGLETAGEEPKQRSYGSEDEDEDGAARCLDWSSRRCLVGMHPLEGGDGDGPEYRLKRLVDGVPGVVREDRK
jgi:serine/threonine-protein kinase/endoribonuclease IRE1